MQVAGSRYRWVVLGVGALGAGAFAALRMGLPSLGPALRERYDLTLSGVGLAFTAVSLGVMLTLLPWGLLTDRIGERPVMTIGLAGTALSLLGAALAPSFGLLLAGLLAAGMFGASATGASGRAIMFWFSRTERGTALGIRQMALPLGGAMSSLTLPHLADANGVDAALLVLAGLSATAALAALLWLRDGPPAPPEAVAFAATTTPPLRDPRSWRLGAGSGLLVFAQTAMLGFLVLFLHDARDVSVGVAAAALAATQLAAAGSRIVAGRRSDRAGSRLPLLRTIALRNAALVAGVALLAGAPGVLLYPVLAVACISTMTWNGLAFTAAAEISGRIRAGTAMSLQNTIVAVGGALGPAVFGVLVGATSWTVGFAVCALAPAAAWAVLAPLEADEAARNAARDLRLSSDKPRHARLPA
ncbi:MAG TPA: MFS transporter [Solirubrobacteraceae bacterium]